jgi:hypothetical protein
MWTPCGLKFLVLRGLRPVNSRLNLRVLTCGRSDNPTFAGTGRGTGFSGPNKELDQGKQPEDHSITGNDLPGGE